MRSAMGITVSYTAAMRFLLLAVAAISASAQILPFDANGITMGHVHLNVADIDVQKKFWIEQFDAKPLAKQVAGLDGVRVPGMLIMFNKRAQTRGMTGNSMDHFGFHVRNLKEMMDRLTAAGYEVGKPFKGAEGFQNAYVTGPDHIYIEMQENVNLTVRASTNHLHYLVKDPMALRAFYLDTMGFTETTRGNYKTANAGAQNLTFGASKEEAGPTKGGPIDHVGFEIKGLEAYCKKLEGKGVKFDIPCSKNVPMGLTYAFLTDPTGTYIELTEGLTAY